jgi:hypothetical protein
MNPEDDSLVGEEAGAGTDEHASEPVTHAAEDGGEEELLGCSVDEGLHTALHFRCETGRRNAVFQREITGVCGLKAD